MNLIGRKNGINIGNWIKIRNNLLKLREEYHKSMFIIQFNKLIRLKKDNIENII
jgi:hypothetical protein